jgi:PAS domain S-box-containing protein
MQVHLRRFSVIVGFSILVAMLIAGTFVTRRRVNVEIYDHYRVAHTRQVLFELEQTDSLLKDAETGQRGFLYTGDAKYLAPYSEAAAVVESHIDSLSQLVADNPGQSVFARELRNLSHEELAELKETIDLFQAGKRDDARVVVLSDRGLAIMSRIRRVIDALETRELALDTERSARYERNVRETILWIYIYAAVAVMGLASLAYFILREMRLREEHNEEILQREEWFRTTLTSIGDAVIATDREGTVTFLNPAAGKLTGLESKQAVGRVIQDVFPIFNEFTGATSENPVQKVIEKGQVVGLANHTVLRHVDGRHTPIEDSAAPIYNEKEQLIGVVLVFRDVTAERQSQELLRKSEKLSAAARLSATVAHEINNPLEAVSNLIYIAKLAPDTPSEVVEHLTLAEHELARVAHITQQTLGFYRESKGPRPLELTPIIDSVMGLYSNKLKSKNIHVQREYEECPPVIGVPGEIRQAIANLLSNAVDAVGQNGNIAVSVRCVRDSEDSEIQLVIEDDGPGIPIEDVHRIFEPFFTTKKDVGTGLGLYVTREILERHGGSVTVRSGADHKQAAGACFVLRLPCDRDPHAHESVASRV